MIRFSRENKKFFLRKSSNWITIVSSEPIIVEPNSSYTVDTGLKFWLDSGTTALLIEASLPPVLRIVNKSLRGRSKLLIELYNTSDTRMILSTPIEICYLIPLATAYFTNIELEEINDAWFNASDSIAEI